MEENVINPYLKVYNIKCECNNGFFGHNCEHKLSCINCQNEKCMINNQCTECNKGWKEKNCIVKDCEGLKMCGKNGSILLT